MINKLLSNKRGDALPVLIIITVMMIGLVTYLYARVEGMDKLSSFKLGEKIDKKAQRVYSDVPPAEVMITQNGFVPSTITVVSGQSVTFVNQDKNIHRVIPDKTDSGLPRLDSENLQPTDSFTYSFEESGTFTLTDKISSSYRATVIVD